MPTAHVDTFARDNLPPAAEQPQFLFALPELQFPAQLNCASELLDRHVADGSGGRVCIRAPGVTWTYAELQKKANRIAHVLASDLGLVPGNRVLLRAPNNPMLAACWFGVIKAGGIAVGTMPLLRAKELKAIIDKAQVSHALCDAALADELREAAAACPTLRRLRHFNHAGPDSLEAAMQRHGATFANVDTAADDTCLLAFTSGTTGVPKGVVRDNGGHAVALHYSMKAIYDCDAGDVFWAASDVGWVVGHSYIVYGPLLRGCTSVLFEGKPVRTPDAGVYWRVIQDHGVKSFFVAPTAFRAIKKEDPDCALKAQYDVSSLKYQFVAGERLDPPTYHWLEAHLKIPVIDHWWQTETGWSIAANCLGIELAPVKAGSVGRAAPGWEVRALDEGGKDVAPGDVGAIACKLPLPPGTLPGLWNAEARFRKSYLETFPGYYETGDAGFIDEDGYIFVMSRTDDVINVAGHRLSTGAIEEVLAAHDDVAECAVIGASAPMKGQLPVGFLVLKAGAERSPEEVVADVIQMVRAQVGPVAVFKKAVVVNRLPKTRSGKVLRATMRKIADSEEYKVPATIEDPQVLNEVESALQTLGYASPGK